MRQTVWNAMIARFCLYSIFKNLRFADPFLFLFLMHCGHGFAMIGLLLGYQHLLTVCLEIPSGYLADCWGRRRVLLGFFMAIAACFLILGQVQRLEPESSRTWVCVALSFFGLGEALRTGSHKAIMLDYLDSTGQSERGTEVLGLTRSYSKFSAGISAISGGILLFAFQRFDVLFWISAAPALAGVVLMISYPRYLDGECSRARNDAQTPPAESWQLALRGMFGRPGTTALIAQSVVFESQVKVLLKYYAQPIIQVGLEGYCIRLIHTVSEGILSRSAGLWIGVAEFLREGVGGLAARMSRRFESGQPSRETGLERCHLVVTLAGLAVVITVSFLSDWLLPALFFFLLLTILQNLRRPLFVSALNEKMEKSMRATVLSVESVARAALVSVTLPLMGWIADRHGMAAAMILPASVLLLGLPTAGLLISAQPEAEAVD